MYTDGYISMIHYGNHFSMYIYIKTSYHTPETYIAKQQHNTHKEK